MTKLDSKYLKRKFPHLAQEIDEQAETISLDGVRTDVEEARKATYPNRAKGPTVIDFLRLCDTDEEALEIIDFSVEQGKIDSKRAKKLKRQLVNRGLRSFGSKREPGKF
ncbi:hypothetical protein AKJ47_00540 [candidate division MSBL1 archaeon SCGC-AAA261G05]|uniref:DUF2095 domain-containing protein n=2 Tax=candidate division MSBL1 TaxID=215777 RepID=A0A133V1G0_9EURY|nr:hypothetical protein AKJ42_01285 [candidate division MSBL1 archaeon SCGC-AAA261C02]KXB04174.1 hypothetical protein AKJ47_00540 [candidate division MSBL1 archaeon SCGC-AAA261G05]